jgi:catechol 2,3-dioxygenase-like lactoylglutathione lyase family enzyme
VQVHATSLFRSRRRGNSQYEGNGRAQALALPIGFRPFVGGWIFTTHGFLVFGVVGCAAIGGPGAAGGRQWFDGAVDPWAGDVGAITLFVEDLDLTRSFYEVTFDRLPVFEDDDSVVFRFGNTMVNLLSIAAAEELVAPATVGTGDAGARFQLSVPVDDVDATCRELTARGVELLNGPVSRPWGIRTASFRDPAGHIWEIAH